MTDRIIDCSQQPAKMHLRNGLLVVEREGSPETTIPLSELAALILGNRGNQISGALLGELAAENVAVICCDSKLRPSGMLLPLEAMHAQSQRFQAQAGLPIPVRKQLWRRIVRAKILAQADVLRLSRGQDFGLPGFAARVRSGDPDNVEAQAARHYWVKLFPESSFVRRNAEDERNHLLNYGYAVLRAAVARSLCASGLHPGFGIHHRSPYNTFPLADDLMEPFRPKVDQAVAGIVDGGGSLELGPATKPVLLEALTRRYRSGEESRTLLDWILRAAQSLAACVLAGDASGLTLPGLLQMEEGEEGEVPVRRKDAARAVPNHVALRDVRSSR